MKAAPPSSAPGRPRTRQAHQIAICVEPGPGSTFVAASPCSKSSPPIHLRRSTTSSRSIAT